MAPLRSPRVVGVEVLSDYNTGKHYRFDQNTGECSLCTVKGDPVAKFHLGTTGVASKHERRERGLGDFSGIAPDADLPGYVGLPEKWVGYQQMPRPEIDMDVNADYSFRISKHLRPNPPKIGKVSTVEKKPPPPRLKWKDSRPTFLNCMTSQFAPTIKISTFLETVTQDLHNWDDVNTLTAKNKQLLIDSMGDPLADLKKQRSKTSGRFGSRHPPFNPQEIQKRENMRDKQINPTKYKKANLAYEQDKLGVEQRRRDRYMQHYVQKDEEEALRKAQQEAAMG